MSGVIAYVQSKRDWLRRILLFCLVAALVPGLNSMFILFNSSYYARWFYMPILLMALATVQALRSRSIDLERGIRWTFIFTAGVTIILGRRSSQMVRSSSALQNIPTVSPPLWRSPCSGWARSG